MSATAKQTPQEESTDGNPSQSREERFRALRSRLTASTKANHADVIAEHKRMKLEPAHLAKLDRKKAEAEMKLSKQDAEDAGEDFDRKRAWDWTMEESEAWDRKLAGKQRNRDESGFAGSLGSCSCVLIRRLYTGCRKVVQTGS